MYKGSAWTAADVGGHGTPSCCRAAAATAATGAAAAAAPWSPWQPVWPNSQPPHDFPAGQRRVPQHGGRAWSLCQIYAACWVRGWGGALVCGIFRGSPLFRIAGHNAKALPGEAEVSAGSAAHAVPLSPDRLAEHFQQQHGVPSPSACSSSGAPARSAAQPAPAAAIALLQSAAGR